MWLGKDLGVYIVRTPLMKVVKMVVLSRSLSGLPVTAKLILYSDIDFVGAVTAICNSNRRKSFIKKTVGSASKTDRMAVRN